MSIFSYSPESLKLLSQEELILLLQQISSVNLNAPQAAANDISIEFSGSSVLDSLIIGASIAIGSTNSQTSTTGSLLNKIQDLNKASSGEFFIIYKDIDSVERQFGFSLLPAIESSSRQSGAVVPEVKPGLLYRTSMKVKNFALPGASPAFQMLGVEQSIFQIVGTFIGNEGVTTSKKSTSNLYSMPSKEQLNAHEAAMRFNYEVVQLGRPVTMVINSHSSLDDKELNIRVKCLIQNIRYFFTKSDRTYYSLECVVLDYAKPLYGPPTPTGSIAAPTTTAPVLNPEAVNTPIQLTPPLTATEPATPLPKTTPPPPVTPPQSNTEPAATPTPITQPAVIPNIVRPVSDTPPISIPVIERLEGGITT